MDATCMADGRDAWTKKSGLAFNGRRRTPNRGMTMLSSIMSREKRDLNSNPEVAINANDHDWTLSMLYKYLMDGQK